MDTKASEPGVSGKAGGKLIEWPSLMLPADGERNFIVVPLTGGGVAIDRIPFRGTLEAARLFGQQQVSDAKTRASPHIPVSIRIFMEVV